VLGNVRHALTAQPRQFVHAVWWILS
jgi:hypothetical protein